MASKFADDVANDFLKGKGKEPDGDEPAGGEAPKGKPGSKGRMLAAALKRGDGEAIEEAVKAICDDTY